MTVVGNLSHRKKNSSVSDLPQVQERFNFRRKVLIFDVPQRKQGPFQFNVGIIYLARAQNFPIS